MKKVLVFALIAMVAGSAMAQNVVLNPGFETAGGETWLAQDWTLAGSGVWRNDANPYAGTWHLSIDASQDPAALQTIDGLSAWADLPITLSAYVEVVGGDGGNVYMGANQFDSSDTFISNHESAQIWGTTGYEQFFVNFDGAANLDSIEVYFKSDEVSGRRFDIDNVSLTAIPEPATMSLLGLGALAMVLRRKMKK